MSTSFVPQIMRQDALTEELTKIRADWNESKSPQALEELQEAFRVFQEYIDEIRAEWDIGMFNEKPAVRELWFELNGNHFKFTKAHTRELFMSELRNAGYEPYFESNVIHVPVQLP